MRIFTLILLTLFLTGCATEPVKEDLTPAKRAKVTSITIYKNNPVAQFKYHGKVSGSACRYNEALEGAKVKAVILRANSIVNLECKRHSDSHWDSGCKVPMKCSGDAITIK